uniref:Solute-binding protein family 3/N-terminal domain-containing protein n=1 Tax=Arion vulgaris TaxID=1028688 RepID=A0A0B6ZXS1_9EUPU
MPLYQILTFILLLGVAALVQAATLYYSSENPETKHQINQNVSRRQFADSHVYLFVADGKMKPYSYIDDFGKLVGFDVDIVNEVCRLTGKRCYTVLAEFTECIFTDRDIEYAGRGLMADWFDACPSYQITNDRQNEFDFTLPYLESSSSFTVAPGNPSKFDPDSNDYSQFTLLHLTGAPTNAPCLTRLHKKFGTILVAQDLPEAKLLLLNGSADALFSPRNAIAGLDVLPQRVHCDNGGAGIMLKKGSTIPEWWNPAFQTFYFSGEYTRLCNDGSMKYGGKIKCLPPPEKMSKELSAIMRASQPFIPEKLWKFVVSGRIAPYSYLNDEGTLVGFTKDMLDTVCERAGKKCALLLAQVPECTVRIGELLYPGRGLMEGWFDACTGYFNTQDRENSWDFTSPYLVSNASFYVRKGNPSKFDPDSADYSSFIIVYQATSITNKHCLNRLYKKFNQIIVVEDKESAIALIKNKTADTWFTKEVDVSQLEQLPQRFHCENVGTSIMTRKGSDLPSWWNVAFEEFFSTGEYTSFCEEKGRQYNYNFPCVEGPSVPPRKI